MHHLGPTDEPTAPHDAAEACIYGSDGQDETPEILAKDLSRRAMLRRIGGGIAVSAAMTAAVRSAPAAPVPAIELPGQIGESPMSQIGTEAFAGTWTYRSFINNPTANVAFNNLRFGEGELVIDAFPKGSFSGRLGFGGTTGLKLTGSSSFGNPFAVRFQGVGDSPDNAEWVYDYVGFLVPVWPNGVDQRPAIVGSIVRTAPHDGNPAGVVASWIAVKRD
jgi:hypothetical protein